MSSRRVGLNATSLASCFCMRSSPASALRDDVMRILGPHIEAVVDARTAAILGTENMVLFFRSDGRSLVSLLILGILGHSRRPRVDALRKRCCDALRRGSTDAGSA
uniref:Putative secreted protein n=1 Tax=Ixodes ricinus TaxID=34613 RepID=A0A6B0UBD7_IXORI